MISTLFFFRAMSINENFTTGYFLQLQKTRGEVLRSTQLRNDDDNTGIRACSEALGLVFGHALGNGFTKIPPGDKYGLTMEDMIIVFPPQIEASD